jgi:hypothetical protein
MPVRAISYQTGEREDLPSNHPKQANARKEKPLGKSATYEGAGGAHQVLLCHAA